MKYLNYLVSLLLITSASSCANLDTLSYTKAPNDPIEVKFLPLEKVVQDNAKFESDIIDNNICEIYGEKYGYIIHKGQYNQKLKGYTGSLVFGALLGGVPWLLGVPLFTNTVSASVEYEIQNSKKETIAKFSGEGKGRAPCALYYGYNAEDTNTKAVHDASNMAHKEIRSQLTKEVVADINEKLKATGKIQ